MNRVLIIGWDGADWRILDPMLKAGHLPVLERLVAEGVSGPLRSTLPTHSYTAWASFMTGKNPGKHGVYAFMDRQHPAQSGRSIAVDRRSMAGETFFETLARHGRKIGTAHVPLSFPPLAIDSFWISGMVIPEGATYVYPPDLQPALEAHAGPGFGGDIGWNRLQNEWDRLFDLVEGIARSQIRGMFYLLDRFAWDAFAYVFVSPDRLQHAAMRLLDEAHPDHQPELARRYLPRVVEHFRMLDSALGEALERVGRDTLVLLISDHGFRSCWCGWSAADWLRQRGYLTARRDWRKLRRLLRGPAYLLARLPKRRAAMAALGTRVFRDSVDWSRTRAYVASASEQGIRINLKGREPLGTVTPDQYQALRERLRAEICALVDPDTGQPLIKKVYFREELYHGDKLDDAPDLVFDLAPGVGVPITPPGYSVVLPTGWKSGEHDREGILVAHGPHVPAGRRLEGACLIDIAPTVLHLLGVPVPEDMDGVFLADLFAGEEFGPVRFEAPHATESEPGAYTTEEQAQLEERLQSLGYL